MRNWSCAFLILAAGVAMTPATAQEATPMARVFPYPTHVETLENGLRVIMIPMPSEGLVACWTIVRTGSRDEYEPGHSGFAHFFEHMMFRGTERFPKDLYNRIVTELGASANAYTTDDLTAYHLAFAAEDLEHVMEIESDRFQRLSYSEEDFKTEAGAVYGEYRKSRTNPFFVIYEALHRAAFKVHTYGHTTIGFEEDIKRMPTMYEYSKSFFERYYRPDNVVLLIAGDIEPEATLELVRRYYGQWEPGYVPPKIPTEPPQTEERRIEVHYEGRSLPILWAAYKIDAFDPGNRLRVAADVLEELAFGETSELYKKLVLEEQVVEFLAAEANWNRDPGLLDIYTRIKDPARVDYVLEQIDATVAHYQQELPDPKRLADLKSRLKYAFLMNLDTPSHVAGNLARIVAITGGTEAVDRLFAAYEAVTPEDVQHAAREYLKRERRTVAVLRGQP